MGAPALDLWHRIAASNDVAGLDALLADDAVFHSPVVHTPQVGKAIVTKYLATALAVLGGSGTFRYVREIVGERDALLEFVAELDGIHVNGVDLIAWNDAGRVTDFKVMVRPLKAINVLHQKMGEALMRGG
ncbi:MAG TPA: nuclear transport factor 2 family protein [Nevskiaceae bacterium]|nr:nuclear transport factor 2 family protein [Nevskiaceae bacterium]